MCRAGKCGCAIAQRIPIPVPAPGQCSAANTRGRAPSRLWEQGIPGRGRQRLRANPPLVAHVSDQLLLLLAPLTFSALLALIGAVAKTVDPRQTRRRRLQATFEATKDRPDSLSHQTADIMWSAYLRQEAESAETHQAAAWSRSSNIMWLFAGALLVATFAVGIADPAKDVDETILALNPIKVFESSSLGAVFVLALASAASAMAFAVVSWRFNKKGEDARTKLTARIERLPTANAVKTGPEAVPDPEGHPAEGPNETRGSIGTT